MYQVYNCQFPNISQGSQRIAQNSNSSLTENKMKFALVLSSLVLIVLASAYEAEDSNSELAESVFKVESSDLELLRLGRDAGKKDRRKVSKRGKKGKGKKKNLKKKKSKKGMKSKKYRRNKKKQRQNDKLSPIPCPVPPTCDPMGCEADIAQKMKDLKKVSNWIKQYKRLATFLKRVSNKKGKSNNFVNASMALESATMNGTMCGTGGPDADANAAFNTLKVSFKEK